MKNEEITTIHVKKSVVKQLKEIRKYPRETYNEIILNLIKTLRKQKSEDNATSFFTGFSKQK